MDAPVYSRNFKLTINSYKYIKIYKLYYDGACMHTKNALGNLINRYKAVLKKCNFLNKISGSMGAGLMAAGLCACFALTPAPNAHAINTQSNDYYTIEQAKDYTNYYTVFNLVKNGINTNYGMLLKAGPGSTATFDTAAGLANALILQSNPSYSIASGAGGLHDFTVSIGGQNLAYTVTSPSASSSRIASLTTNINNGIFYGITSATRGGAIDVNANSDLSINGTFIANTSATLGGAVSLWGSNNINTSGTFIGNSAVQNGGAIYAISGSVNSTSGMFIGNSSGVHGGAIANASTMNFIDGIFIGNSAKGWGGAIFNIGNQIINSISGTFIANNASDGGAIFNSDSSFISSINANFIGNASNYTGGAISNRGIIHSINGIFIENTAKDFGGALQNFASTNMSDVQIGSIDASFINNRTTGAGGLGGAIWTNRELTFRANNRVNVFSGNMDSTGYNAIYVEDSNHDAFVSLNFNMFGSGGFVMNDSIRTNGVDFYDVNISGQSNQHNVFELNNIMSGVKTLNLSSSRLRLGSVIQNGQSSSGQIYVRNARFTHGSIFEVPATNIVNLVGSGGFLYADSTSKLYITDTAPVGTDLNIAEGFSAMYSWTDNNIVYGGPTSLLQVKANPFDLDHGRFSVKIRNNSAAGILRDYPEMQSSTAEFLSHVDPDVHSESAGVRLVSRAADTRYIGRDDHKRATRTIEGLLQLGYIAGLNKSGLDVGLTAASSVQARLSPTNIGTAKGEAPAVAMPKSESVEQGSSAGSHAQASGIKDGFALWLSPLYKHSFAHGYESGKFEHRRSTDIGGLSLGGDYTFNEMFRMGLALNLGTGYTQSSGDFAHTANDFDFWNLSLYGAFYKNNFALMADLGFSNVYGDIQQELPTSMQMADVQAGTISTVWTAGLRAEYTFNTSFMDITPYAGARYMQVLTHGFDVSSGGTVANTEADNQGIWYFPVGVTFTKDIVTKNNWTISPKFDLGIVAAIGDLDTTTKTHVSGVSGAAEYTMQNVDGLAFSGGLGMEIMKDNFSMGFNYNLLASQHETGHTLFATFKYSF